MASFTGTGGSKVPEVGSNLKVRVLQPLEQPMWIFDEAGYLEHLSSSLCSELLLSPIYTYQMNSLSPTQNFSHILIQPDSYQELKHSKSFIKLSLQSNLDMGIRLPSVLLIAKQILRTQSVSDRCQSSVPKGHVAVYVGEIQRKRFLVPVSYLNHPLFVDLLSRAEEEFGFNQPTGGLTIPCKEEAFIDVTSRLHTS